MKNTLLIGASRAAAIFVVCFAFLPSHAAPRFADPVDDLARLYELIDARLALMDDVAAWKWRQQRSIADPDRERQVTQAMVAQASVFGLDAAATRAFFELQISLARDIQERRFGAWRTRGFDDRPIRDLDSEVRPRLDSIGVELVRALYLAAPELAGHIDDARVAALRGRIGARFSDALKTNEALRATLLQFKAPEAGRLNAIRASNVLRIGTTGDYAPFSLEQNDELRGLDIALGLALAKNLGVEVRFVRTSWPTLMDDLQRRRFDIAASGISVTPERAAAALFSPAYHLDGKTPIARCAERERYGRLQAIDQPSVRVIVNPGGANERFARERLSRAQLYIHADNRTVFDEIVANRADVMVTDAIEADFQTRKHPELCRTTQETFTSAQKAMLMPQQADFSPFADRWLREEIARGGVQSALQAALQEALDAP